MRVAGDRRFEAPRDTVWRVLNDPASMAKTMPGVESFDVTDDRHWKANVKVPLGLGGLRLSISFEKLEEQEPEFAKLHAKGNGVGAIMNMETSFRLADAGGVTDMHWEADVRIAGPVGSMGQRVLQPIVNQQVSHVLAALDRQVQEARATEASEGYGDTGETVAPSTGGAGTPEPTTEREPPETDPELKDAGEPAEGTAEEGSSGAEEGLNPWAPESYESEPEGPTTSTEDS
jgi:uncharacterized protein